MFASLLIANRGEIVARIAATARRLGVATVAIASDADLAAPFTASCEQVVAIGGAHAADSYLRIDKIIAAARSSGAAAIHPGYGFLSERADFAEAVEAAGLVWIGPPAAAMRAMADKASARRRMRDAGVPVLPGYDGAAQDAATLRAEARRLGYPLMVKAVAGGGGRGMRLVADDGELDAALAAAAGEAAAAFGDARLLLERAVERARHVEIQVFADSHGHVVHLGERDCSLQRRHQKLVEEAPSPAVTPALRRRMGDVAVAVARAVGYLGAGTVEFLLDAQGDFRFIEMNTRLQVEHAVTEAVLGVDLVEWQLRVASGEALPWTQDKALARYEAGGHAIEARLCAEDPARSFLPQSGRIIRWRAAPGVRTDHALADGATVPPFYDSMLARVIAHAPDRREAIERLAAALDATVCWGVTTNRAFLARVMRDADFAAGAVDTTFLARRLATDATRATPAPAWLEAIAAASLALVPRAPLPALWAGWSSSPSVDTVVPIEVDGVARRWRLVGTRDAVDARCGDATHRITALARGPDDDDLRLDATVDGRARRVAACLDGAVGHWQAEGAELAAIDLRLRAAARAAAPASGVMLAPLHGRVTQACVEAGASVDAGALLVVIEAMKMEHQVRAPHAGTVAALHVRAGDQVAVRQPLVEVRA
ncbi:MAG TPA: biotin carboxylase N-terminal domain-containing protein [Caldimonas sp.]|jgi:geranyl-CoA carboxylase alpha subunit|nr:biotin carboxylase N-terminal domain-containing protein [Caldimonas sp.]